MYFDDCDNLKALGEEIKEFLLEPSIRPPVWAMQAMEGLLSMGPAGEMYARDAKSVTEAIEQAASDAFIKAMEFWDNDNSLPKPEIQESTPRGKLEKLFAWCIEADRIKRKRGKKRRAPGERSKHVEEAYKALSKSEPNRQNIKAKHLARWINNEYGKTFRKMTADNVGGSDPWKDCHKTKT